MIPKTTALLDIQDAFRDVERKLKPLNVGNIDLTGRRIINAGKAVGPFDYVTKLDLDSATTPLSEMIQQIQDGTSQQIEGAITAQGPVRIGVFASRGSAGLDNQGHIFIASDHQYIGWISSGTAWIYLFGTNQKTQSGLSTLTGLLTVNDRRYRVEVTDYVHVLIWNGSGWGFAPEDDGSNYYVLADEAPLGGFWQACDGSTITFLRGDGTLTTKILDDLTTPAYLAGSNAAGGVLPASGATGVPSATVLVDNHIDGSTVAVATGTHTHDPDILQLRRKQMVLYFRR
jgi:hypothetical protein